MKRLKKIKTVGIVFVIIIFIIGWFNLSQYHKFVDMEKEYISVYTGVLESIDINNIKETFLTTNNIERINRIEELLKRMDENAIFANRKRYERWERFYNSLKEVQRDVESWDTNSNNFNFLLKNEIITLKESNVFEVYE